jgi:hypothetical protein
MEPRFGYDFSQVRIHGDAKANASARAVNAIAYTVGSDVVFAQGQFNPGTQTGSTVLAHELAHVVQQRDAVYDGGPLTIGDPGSSAEQEAEAASRSLVSGGSEVSLHANGGPSLQRLPGSPAGGCGVCYGLPKFAGLAAHTLIQAAFLVRYPGMQKEHPVLLPGPGDENARLDLADLVGPELVEIGEIKPDNPEGRKQGSKDLIWYERQLRGLGFQTRRLNQPPPFNAIDFPTLGRGPTCPATHKLYVNAPDNGVYTYWCTPDFKDLRRRCKCSGSSRRRREPVRQKQEQKQKQEQEQKQKQKQRQKEPEKDRVPGPEVLLPVAALVALGAILKQLLKKAAGGPALGFASAAAAIILLASGKARAELNLEGEDPLFALFRAFEAEGAPVPEEIKQLIASDPELRELVNKGLRTGEIDEAQKQIADRMSKWLADNANQITPDDLKLLAGFAEFAGNAVPELEGDFSRLRAEIQTHARGRQPRRTQPGESGGKRPEREGAESDRVQSSETKTGTSTPGEVSKNRHKLLQEIRRDPDLNSTLEAILGPGGIEANEEFLRRLVVLKPLIKRHSTALAQFLASRQEGDLTDPISQIIVPLEKFLNQEERGLRQRLEETASVDKPNGAQEGEAEIGKESPKAKRKDSSAKRKNQGTTAPAQATVIRRSFADLIASGQITFPAVGFQANHKDPKKDTPKKRIQVIAELTIESDGSALVYDIVLDLTFKRKVKTPDGFVWYALYEYTIPRRVFRSRQGDVPIRFEDNRTYEDTWGREKRGSD